MVLDIIEVVFLVVRFGSCGDDICRGLVFCDVFDLVVLILFRMGKFSWECCVEFLCLWEGEDESDGDSVLELEMLFEWLWECVIRWCIEVVMMMGYNGGEFGCWCNFLWERGIKKRYWGYECCCCRCVYGM